VGNRAALVMISVHLSFENYHMTILFDCYKDRIHNGRSKPLAKIKDRIHSAINRKKGWSVRKACAQGWVCVLEADLLLLILSAKSYRLLLVMIWKESAQKVQKHKSHD